MFRVEDLSIRSKLILLSVLSGGIALSISCVGFITVDLHLLYQAKQRQLSAQAQMLGFNAGVVLLMQDRSSAEQLLEPLAHQPSIAAAALYSEKGSLIAGYAAQGQSPVPSEAGRTTGYSKDSSGAVEILEDIREGGQIVGRLYLRADMSDLSHQRSSYFAVAATVVIVSLLSTLLLSRQLQRPIARPIVTLADAAKQVTRQGDYSVRVNHVSRDEVGELCSAFNTMLERVEASETSLKQHQDELEHRVRERTADLIEEIAQRGRVQKDLLIAKDAAEAASLAKSEFLANMSHEIRTPMTAILGFSEILANDSGPQRTEEERDALETILRNGQHLLTIINDILDLSKIEAGKMQVERIVCSPQQIIGEVISLMRVRAKSKELDLSLVFDGAIPEFFTTDPVRLRQILINLIGNAIKFTELGVVVVRVRCELTGPAPQIMFDVVDTGIGISEEQLGRLFQSFEQGDTSTTRRFGGTGLGLTIGQRMAKLLGGAIEVSSEFGNGSTFRLRLPTGSLDNVRLLTNLCEASRLQASSAQPRSDARFDGLKVLVAEDGKDNQRLLQYLLKKLGAEPTLVENGQLAVDAALAARDSNVPFELFLCDMAMPVLDGYETVAMLRSMSVEFPMIAITAHAMSGDRERCIAAGCDDYLPKPIDCNSLVAVIQRQLGRKPLCR